MSIFNFGDSNSGTDGFCAAFPQDCIAFYLAAEALGLPFLSPYLQSIGSDYKDGANYATMGPVCFCLISLFVIGISPFSLSTRNKLSSRDIFGISIYTFYIGQNDFTSNLATIGISGVPQYFELYNLGGCTFMVLNLAHVGCFTSLLEELPRSHGLQYGIKACCGYGGSGYNFDPKVYCGDAKGINGSTVTATAFDDPYNYASWDRIHATDVANKLILPLPLLMDLILISISHFRNTVIFPIAFHNNFIISHFTLNIPYDKYMTRYVNLALLIYFQ
uniref:GDSL esterase/lipase At4g01130 family n=1 Tax=Cajanus cajan TaxID=3821 RepID=A0A151TXS9_CAJCA|nr:GDSL esterase/lipase At4g01130 family [Cajanus cajan]